MSTKIALLFAFGSQLYCCDRKTCEKYASYLEDLNSMTQLTQKGQRQDCIKPAVAELEETLRLLVNTLAKTIDSFMLAQSSLMHVIVCSC